MISTIGSATVAAIAGGSGLRSRRGLNSPFVVAIACVVWAALVTAGAFVHSGNSSEARWIADIGALLFAGVSFVSACTAVARLSTTGREAIIDFAMLGVASLNAAIAFLIRPLLDNRFDRVEDFVTLIVQIALATTFALSVAAFGVCTDDVLRRRLAVCTACTFLPAAGMALASRGHGSLPYLWSTAVQIGWGFGFLALLAITHFSSPFIQRLVPHGLETSSWLRTLTPAALAVLTQVVVAVDAAARSGENWFVIGSVVAIGVLVAARLNTETQLQRNLVLRTTERNRLANLVDLSAAIVATHELPALFALIGEGLAKSAGADRFVTTDVAVRDRSVSRGGDETATNVDLVDVLRRDHAFARAPITIGANDQRFPSQLRAKWQAEARSIFIVVPIWSNDALIGVIEAWRTNDSTPFLPAELDAAGTIAREGSFAIQTAQSLAANTRSAVERAMLLRVSQSAASNRDIDTVLADITNSMLDVAGIECASIELWDPTTNTLRIGAQETIADWPGTDIVGSLLPIDRWPFDKRTLQHRNPVHYRIDDPALANHEVLELLDAGIGSVLNFPLWVGDEVLGLLKFFSRRADAFGEHEIQLGQEISGQTSLAIHNARLLDVERARSTEQEALLRVARAATASLDLYAVLNEIAAATIGVAGIECTAIELWHSKDDELEIAAQVTVPEWPDVDEPGTRYPVGFWEWDRTLLASRDPVWFNLSDPDLDASSRSRMRDSGTGSFLVVPIWLGDECLGLFDYFSRKEDAFSEATSRLGAEIASRTALAIHNARLLAAERDRAHEWEILHRISRAATSSLDLQTVLREIAQASLDIPGAESASVLAWDKAAHQLIVWAEVDHESWNEARPVLTRHRDDEFTFDLQVLETLRPVLIEAGQPDLPPCDRAIMEAANVATTVILPLQAMEETTGLLYLSSRQPRAFDEETVRLGQEIAAATSLAIRNAKLLKAERLRADEWATLHRASRAATASLDKETVLGGIAEAALEIPGTERCLIVSLEGNSDVAIIEADVSVPGWEVQNAKGAPMDAGPESFNQWVLSEGRPMVFEDDDPRISPVDQACLRALAVKSLVVVPVSISGIGTGLLYLCARGSNAFGRDAERLGHEIGAQIALAITNARLLDAERQRADERAVLLRVSRAATSSLDLGTVLGEVAEATLNIPGADSCHVLLWKADTDEWEVGGSAAIDATMPADEVGARFPIGSRVFDRRVLFSDEPMIFEANSAETSLLDRMELDRWGAGSIAAFPLLLGSEVVGVLEIFSRSANVFTEDALRVGNDIAGQTALAIRNAQLLQRTRKFADDQAALLRVSRAVSSSFDLIKVAGEIAQACVGIAGAEICEIELWRAESGELESIAHARHGLGASPASLFGTRSPINQWPSAARALSTHQPVIIDATTPTIGPRELATVSMADGFTLLLLPLLVEGESVGLMKFFTPSQDAVSSAAIRLGRDIAAQAALAIERARFHSALTEQANTDGLTGLLNHRAIQERLDAELARAYRSDETLAVLMIDLNNFKYVNDTYGHQIGDTVLRSAANVLRQSVRSYDVVGRYGGDEFMILLPGAETVEAVSIAERIVNSASLVGTRESSGQMPINLSVGISVYPIHASNRQELIEIADRAMYVAKQRKQRQVVSGTSLLPTVAD